MGDRAVDDKPSDTLVVVPAEGLWTGSSTLPHLHHFPVSRRRNVPSATMNAFVLSFGVILLAELGDKTMLATITLATTEEPIGTWLGSTAGMVVAEAIAIGIGAMLGSHLPDHTVKGSPPLRSSPSALP